MYVKLLYNWLVISLLLTLAGCNSQAPAPGQSLRVNLEAKPQVLDPRKARDLVTVSLMSMLYEGLVRVSKNGPVELALAESVDVSEDGLHYTFHLRKSFWSNNEPVTSDDFARSWRTVLDPDFASDLAHQLYPIKGAKEAKLGQISLDQVAIRTPDPSTLAIELESPIPYFLELLTFPSFFAVHRQFDDLNPQWMQSAERLVCNGPFLLKEWDRDRLIIERNSCYWDAKDVKLDQIVFVMVSPDTEYRLFRDGFLDWAGSPLSTLPPDSIQSLAASPSLKICPIVGTQFLKMNLQQNSPLTNASFRKALFCAIDREQITTHILQGGQLPAYSLVPPSLKLPSKKDQFDLKKGQSLLEDYLSQTGQSIEEVPPLHLLYVASGRNHQIAQSLQQQIERDLGVRIELDAAEGKMFYHKIANDDYQIAICSWIADFNDPINFLNLFKYQGLMTNHTGWESSKYIECLDRSALCKNQEERKALLADAEGLLMEELPIIPIFHNALNYLQCEKVKDVCLSPMGRIDFRWAHIDDGSLD